MRSVTGTILDANPGGFWGVQFRKTGHAVLIVRGRAEQPVWIEILQDQATIHDAAELWGMRVLAVTEKLGRIRTTATCSRSARRFVVCD